MSILLSAICGFFAQAGLVYAGSGHNSSVSAPLYAAGFNPLMALSSGVATTVSITGEALFSERVYFTLEGTYLTMNFSALTFNSSKAEKSSNEGPSQSDATVERTTFVSLAPGARWYSRPSADTWYGGGGLGLSRSNSVGQQTNRHVTGTSTDVFTEASSGYRWIFRPGGYVLAGVGARYSKPISQEYSSEEGSPLSSEEKVLAAI